MTPTISGSNCSIKSNGSGPGHSSHKFKRQECQPRGEAKMEYFRTSTISQRLDRSFDTLLEILGSEMTAILVVRYEKITGRRSIDIPVSVKEMVYGGKEAGVGISENIVDRDNEIISPSEEALGSGKDT
ncbi:hypothetical protein O181_108249 [Austropuccinia psidii MF-1]|uniref:Uncharacterized protein n=1 Tax=Austropuccinia psidii MF-1 TaxID=1389203 RepID=A0A9Q3PNS5_9BASI|nr:hypothetical protein [Austropuccinia psidii MF-1]